MKNIKEILLGLVFVVIMGGGVYLVTTEKKLPEGMTKTVVETGVENYKGKTTAVVIVGTYCPYCQKDVPEIEREVFEKTEANDLNLVVNVIDGEGGKSFDTKMKQVFNPELRFTELTGEECGYVPSWVVMDGDWNVVDSDCGNKKQNLGLIETLQNLGIDFKE